MILPFLAAVLFCIMFFILHVYVTLKHVTADISLPDLVFFIVLLALEFIIIACSIIVMLRYLEALRLRLHRLEERIVTFKNEISYYRGLLNMPHGVEHLQTHNNSIVPDRGPVVPVRLNSPPPQIRNWCTLGRLRNVSESDVI